MSNRIDIRNLPEWLYLAVEDYRVKHDIQSLSQAATILLAVGFSHATGFGAKEHGYFGGTEEADNHLYNEFAAARDAGKTADDFEVWLVQKIAGTWGGKRR